jgi:LAO/AO transport system kinase
VNQEIFKAHPFMKNISPLTDEQYSLLTKLLLAAAPENRITCSGAIAIAKKLGIPSGEIGKIADRLNIRISKCQLGCF